MKLVPKLPPAKLLEFRLAVVMSLKASMRALSMKAWATLVAMTRRLSLEAAFRPLTNIGVMAAKTMPASKMVTSSSTRVKPLSRLFARLFMTRLRIARVYLVLLSAGRLRC